MTSLLQGCQVSEEVKAHTMEDIPRGDLYLQVKIEGPNTISTMWNPILVPNGKIYYDVYVTGLYYINPGIIPN